MVPAGHRAHARVRLAPGSARRVARGVQGVGKPESRRTDRFRVDCPRGHAPGIISHSLPPKRRPLRPPGRGGPPLCDARAAGRGRLRRRALVRGRPAGRRGALGARPRATRDSSGNGARRARRGADRRPLSVSSLPPSPPPPNRGPHRMTAFSFLLLAALQQPAPAAPARLPIGSADTSPFRRLALPTSTLLREGSGQPGPRYWQQRADYVIRAALDTAAHTITGRETIRYTNNSPDTLRYLWLQVDQNIYRTDSRGAAINPTDARFAGAGFVGGYTIESFGEVVAGPRTARGPTTRVEPLHTTVNGTMLRAELDRPLAPARTITLDVAYHFQVPEHGSDRMGRKQYPGGWLYEIAQWYPRMAVYDDVRGWNTEQYLGQGEFYLEYGDFDVAITVPRRYVVATTGTLLNAAEVLTATQRERLARAIRSY